jgi:cobalt-zinc-cadmium efflux system protein
VNGHHHSHHDIHAGPDGKQTRLRLMLSLVITLGFVGVEVIAGTMANSLALLTDAAHNVTDVLALALSWYAVQLADRPAHAGKTYGYHRVGILAALVNSTTLAFIAAGICFEAWQRFQSPAPVAADLLIGVGAIALAVNLVTAWLVSHGAEHDLNLRSAFLHLMGDVISTLGAILAGVGIYFTGLNWLDPLASVLIAGLILWNAWLIVREVVDILLESTPRDIEMSEMVRDLMQIEGVQGIHDLHVWSLSQNLRFLSAHILVEDMPLIAASLLRDRIVELVENHYGVHHATLQFETSDCCPGSLYCDVSRRNQRFTPEASIPQS